MIIKCIIKPTIAGEYYGRIMLENGHVIVVTAPTLLLALDKLQEKWVEYLEESDAD